LRFGIRTNNYSLYAVVSIKREISIYKSVYNKELRNSLARFFDNLLVFEKTKGKNKCFFVVVPEHCNATLIKKRKR